MYLPTRQSLVVAHCECLMNGQSCQLDWSTGKKTNLVDRHRSAPRVPGVDRNARPEPAVTIRARKLTQKNQHTARATHKRARKTYLTQNERPVPPLLALHELVRPQRHAFPEARDKERIRHGQQGKVLAERQVLRVEEHDGLVRERRVARVDVGDDVGDAACELARFGGLEGNLDENDLQKNNYDGVLTGWRESDAPFLGIRGIL